MTDEGPAWKLADFDVLESVELLQRFWRAYRQRKLARRLLGLIREHP
jgi:predicted metal-dependent hydrolase